jgi:hypothetical protein
LLDLEGKQRFLSLGLDLALPQVRYLIPLNIDARLKVCRFQIKGFLLSACAQNAAQTTRGYHAGDNGTFFFHRLPRFQKLSQLNEFIPFKLQLFYICFLLKDPGFQLAALAQ